MKYDELFFTGVNLDEYALSESIRLVTSTKYGLNYPRFDDKKSTQARLLPSLKSSFSTVFTVDKNLFVADFVHTQFQFRTARFDLDTASGISVQNLVDSAKISKQKLDQDLPYQTAIGVFGNALSVAIALSSTHGLKKFEFIAFNEKLHKLYQRAAQNKFLIQDLNMLGWTSKIENDKFLVMKM